MTQPGSPDRDALLDDAERIAGIGSYAWDPTTGALTWSDNCFRLLGYEPGTIEPSTSAVLARIHPDDRDAVQAWLTAAQARPGVSPIEYRVVHPGALRTVRAHVVATRGEQGQLARTVGIIQDVTQELERQRAMAMQAHVLERAQATANIGSWVWAPTSGEISWSHELYRIMGVDPDFVPTLASFDAQVHPEDLPGLRAEREHNVRTGESSPSEVRILRPDGAQRRVVLHGAAVDGPEPRFFGIVHDVTEQHALEERLRRAQAMEAMGRLAGGVAHDFNNLLTVIVGNLTIAMSEQPSEELSDALRAARDSAELTQRLLSVGRATQAPLVPLDLDAAVIGATGLLQRAVPAGIDLQITATSGITIRGDRRQLDQALLNLVTNARDAIGEAGEIKVIAEADPSGGALVKVCDDGPGMDEAVMHRALEPFFTTKASRGAGLGLTMVQGAITNMGGTIDVGPEEGGGTCVRVWLPSTDAIPERQEQDVGAHAVGLRVLIVEDEPAVRALTVRILRNAGMEVAAAADPAEAMAHQGPVDIVLCDVVMPGGGGRAVLEAFAETRPGTPFVFMTGYADRAGWLEGHRVVQKPFLPLEVVRALAAMAQSRAPT